MIAPQSRVESTIAVIWGVLIRLAAVVGILYFAYRVRFILVTVLISAILALAVAPVVDWLSERRLLRVSYSVRRFLVTLAVFVVLLAAAVIGNVYLITPISRELSDAFANVDISKGRIGEYLKELQGWYKGLPPDLRDFLASQDLSGIANRVAEAVRGMVATTIDWLAHAVEIIVIPVLAFYFVLDSRPLKREFLYLVPKRRVRDALILLQEAGRILQSYAVCQIVLCVIAAVVVGIGLKLLGVRYALTMGMLAGITRAIPIIGPILGGIPIVLVSMLQSMTTAVAVLIFFSVLHIVESKIIMPKLLGYGMHLHPAIILIVLLIGSEFFGILGMFLAAPITAMLKCAYTFYMLPERTCRALRASMAKTSQQKRRLGAPPASQPTVGART